LTKAKDDELERLKIEISENVNVLEQRNVLERQLNDQNEMLQNFQFAITAEIGQDLCNTGFTDDQSESPFERIQSAISAYFSHQQTLRLELQVLHAQDLYLFPQNLTRQIL